MRTCTYYNIVSWAGALTNCANGASWITDSTSNICFKFCTALEKMLLIRILCFRWHKISPEGHRQVFTKIDKHHLCQLNNVILHNLSGFELVRRSRSHVKGQRRGGVCVLRMLFISSLFSVTFPPVISALWYVQSMWNVVCCLNIPLVDLY